MAINQGQPRIYTLLNEAQAALPGHLGPLLSEEVYKHISIANEYREERNEAREHVRALKDKVRDLENRLAGLKADHERLRMRHDLLVGAISCGEEKSLRAYLEQVLDLILAETGAEKGVFWILSTSGDTTGAPIELVGRNWSDGDHGLFKEQLELSQGIVRQALATGRAVYTQEAQRDHRFAEHASVRTLKLKTVLCEPLLDSTGTTTGLLYLEHRGRSDAFPAEQQELLTRVLRPVEQTVSRYVAGIRAAEALDHTIVYRQRYGFREIGGRSRAIAEVLKRMTLSLELNLDDPILIQGEPGTGKGIIARALHFNSHRAQHPFVVLDSAMIKDIKGAHGRSAHDGKQSDEGPDASEWDARLAGLLFGHVRGAFPDADRPRTGLLEKAQGGTLFICEIADLSLPVQERLAEAIREKKFSRLGEDAHGRSLDVRLIFGSRWRPSDLKQEGRLIDELSLRLEIYTIVVPPLRERKEDIPILARQFLAQNVPQGGVPPRLSDDAVEELRNTEMPNNIAELREWLNRARMLTTDGIIEASLLRATREPSTLEREFAENEIPAASIPTWKEGMASYQRRLITAAMNATNRNLVEAARLLGISRQHLSRQIDELQLNDIRPRKRGRKARS